MRDAQFFSDLLSSVGVPHSQIPFLVSQIALESANFTDHKVNSHNNPSGIVWTGQAVQNATRGNILPETAKQTKKYYYAKFNSIEDWAKNYVRILNRKPGLPIAADSVESFAAKLKQNNYYASPETAYLKGLRFYLKKYGSIVPGVASTAPVAVILVAVVAAWLLL